MQPHDLGTAPPAYTTDYPNAGIRPSATGPGRQRTFHERTPLLQPAANPDPDRLSKTSSSSCYRSLLLHFLAFAAIILCMGGGIYLDRNLNQDPTDPRVRQRIRHEWEAEEHSWTSRLDSYKAEANATLEKLQHFETDLEEKKRREEKRRLELKVYWGNLAPRLDCLGSGTKTFIGTLQNFDWSIDPYEACRNTPVVINDISYAHPDHCDASIKLFGVVATWTVKGVQECSGYWGAMKDLGCTAAGSLTRRFESPLLGVTSLFPAGYGAVCFSTPTIIMNQRFEKPTSCPYYWFSGQYGVWDVPDSSCI